MTTGEALTYIRAKVADIRALPNRLVRQRQQLALIRDAARASGQLTNAQAAQTRLDEALRDLASAETMNMRLDQVIDAYASVRQAVGLGIIPVLPIAAAVLLTTIAVTAGYLFKAYETRTIAIEQLAKGTLTPQQYSEFQAQQSTTGLGGFVGDVKNLALLGIGAVVVLAVLKYVPTRRTA